MRFRKVFLDMDGVLADFDRGVAELLGMVPRDQADHDAAFDDELWTRAREEGHFYAKLHPMPGAEEFFREVCARYGEKVEILSGVPKPCRGLVSAGEDKTEWMQRHFAPEVPVHIVQRAEKPRYCTGPDCLLIDDYAKNIREWEAAGGTGLLFRGAEDALRKLAELEEGS